MKNFIEVLLYDSPERRHRALIPVDNIAYIEDGDPCVRLYFKDGQALSCTPCQTFDQLVELLSAQK